MIFHHASVAFSFASLRRTSSMLRSQTQSVSISHRLLSASSLFGRGPTKKAPGPVRHDFSKYEDDDTSVDISIKGLDRLAKEHFGSTDASRQRARKEIVVKPVKERVKASAKKDWNNSPVMAVFHKPVGVQSTMKDEWGRESLGKLLHNWPFGKSMHPVVSKHSIIKYRVYNIIGLYNVSLYICYIGSIGCGFVGSVAIL